MILEESHFNEIYHKYQIFEADALTENCKEMIDVSIEDCYMLTTAIVDITGNINFEVLAIGPTEEECTKGLNILEPLASFTSFELENVEFGIIEQPTFEMQIKGAEIFQTEACTRELAQVRKTKELDELRDIHYPDVLNVHFLSDGKFYRYLVEVSEYNSRFIEGRMLKEPDRDIGVHEHEVVEIIPILLNNHLQLVSASSNVQVSDEAFEKLKEFVNEILEDYPEIEKRKKS